MNIDDFVFSDQAGTPAGIESPLGFDNTSGQGIPIKNRKESNANQGEQFVPTSVPHQREGNNEFGYVKRHQRKTSIDERGQVSLSRILPVRLVRY